MIRKTALPAMLVAVMDLALKLLPLGEDRTLVPGFLGLRSLLNRGVAFGLFQGSPLLNALLVSLVLGFAALWLANDPPAGVRAAGAAMMLGGALGNLLDRLLHGAVSDYLMFLFMEFPVFNLADACVSVGAGILILDTLLLGREASG